MTKRVYQPKFDGRTTRATVKAMNENVVTVHFAAIKRYAPIPPSGGRRA